MDTVFFIASKLGWALVSPDSLLVILGVGGWLALVLGWNKLARRLLAFMALGLILIATLPVGEWLLAPLEQRFPTNVALPAEVDGIVVLGGAISPTLSASWGQIELGGAAERLLSFVALAQLFPEARLLFTGGSGSVTEQELKEAESARLLLEQLGLSQRNILFEDQSRNTAENARLAWQLAMPQAEEDWVLITSAAHMPRAMGAFCQQAWELTAYPVDHVSRPDALWRLQFAPAQNLGLLRAAMREWAGLTVYWLTGRSTSLLPGPDMNCSGVPVPAAP